MQLIMLLFYKWNLNCEYDYDDLVVEIQCLFLFCLKHQNLDHFHFVFLLIDRFEFLIQLDVYFLLLPFLQMPVNLVMKMRLTFFFFFSFCFQFRSGVFVDSSFFVKKIFFPRRILIQDVWKMKTKIQNNKKVFKK